MKHNLVILVFVSLVSCQLQCACAQEQRVLDAINFAIADYMNNPRVGADENYAKLMIDTTSRTIKITFLFYYNKNSNAGKYSLSFLLKKVGKYVSSIPTDYVEYKGHLFTWNNPNKPLTHRVINKLKKNNQVFFDPNILMVVVNDGGPHITYHMCKDDYHQFGTQIEEGFFREALPLLPCYR